MAFLNRGRELCVYENVFFRVSSDELELRQAGIGAVVYAKNEFENLSIMLRRYDAELSLLTDLFFEQGSFPCPKWCEEGGQEMPLSCRESNISKSRFRLCLSQRAFQGSAVRS